ncbi:MAG: hypothetical protein IPP85_12245 [Propionivibrio sp.]|nr:hypothetical protein [Propionivibrio sp.]
MTIFMSIPYAPFGPENGAVMPIKMLLSVTPTSPAPTQPIQPTRPAAKPFEKSHAITPAFGVLSVNERNLPEYHGERWPRKLTPVLQRTMRRSDRQWQ